MREDVLRAIYPSLKPMSGINAHGGAKTPSSEMYLDTERKILGSEDVAFGVKDGRLTKFYWSSSKRVSAPTIDEIRRSLKTNLGKSKVGYKARLTKDRIAKITTEVYSLESNKNLVVTLSSALGVTELEVINLTAENVSAEELYFSYERQKQRLQAELSSLTGKSPEEEPSSIIADVLAALIEIDPSSAPTSQAPTVAPPKLKNAPDTKPAPSAPATPFEATSVPAERRAPVWPWVVGILALIVLVAFAFKRRA